MLKLKIVTLKSGSHQTEQYRIVPLFGINVMLQNHYLHSVPVQNINGPLVRPQLQNDFFDVPTQKRFSPLGPINERVEYSMNTQNGDDYVFDQMDVDKNLNRNKRRRFNTGDSHSDILYPSLESKFSWICKKLDNLERSNQTLASIAQTLSTVQSNVEYKEKQTSAQRKSLRSWLINPLTLKPYHVDAIYCFTGWPKIGRRAALNCCKISCGMK